MTVEPKPYGTVFEVPVRLSSSHNIARPGFQSDRKGEFWNAEIDIEKQPLIIENAEVLGVAFHDITLSKRDTEWHLLRLHFAQPITPDDAVEFIRRLGEAFTSSLAGTQRDPWYGNLGLDVGWAGFRDKSPRTSGAIAFVESVGIQSIDRVAVHKGILESLRWSPLASIFVEGMRAAQPKSKFLFWFVVIEELEGREEFQHLFTPLFSEGEKEALLKAEISATAKARLTQLLNDKKTTVEGRPQKLLKILHSIELKKVTSLKNDIEITEALCRSLIKQRNTVAHKGSTIDEDLLYTVLFPLSQGVLIYILDKEK